MVNASVIDPETEEVEKATEGKAIPSVMSEAEASRTAVGTPNPGSFFR
jgi:hypothetical protein